MKYKIILIGLIVGQVLSAQVSSSFVFGQAFSKDMSLYSAKSFLIRDILGVSEDITEFEMDPLTASSSGELTTLAYQCQAREKEGLIFGFYGNYWNDEGVLYTGYAFKDLPKDQAVELLSRISDASINYNAYFEKGKGSNNISFSYNDIIVVMYKHQLDGIIRLRILWNNFDSEWTGVSFNKTKKRFEKYFTKTSTSKSK